MLMRSHWPRRWRVDGSFDDIFLELPQKTDTNSDLNSMDNNCKHCKLINRSKHGHKDIQPCLSLFYGVSAQILIIWNLNLKK